MTGLLETFARPVGAALAAVTGTVARVRSGRPMHARGVVLRATLVVAEDEAGAASVPQGRTPATVRVSLGAGLPRGWPDVVGIAVRWTDDGAAQDLLLASTGHGRGTRYVLVPRRGLLGGWFSTLMPLRSPHGPVLLAVRPDRDATKASGTPTLEVLEASPLGPWRRFGAIELHGPVAGATPDGDDPGLRFEPPGTLRTVWAPTRGRTRCALPATPPRAATATPDRDLRARRRSRQPARRRARRGAAVPESCPPGPPPAGATPST